MAPMTHTTMPVMDYCFHLRFNRIIWNVHTQTRTGFMGTNTDRERKKKIGPDYILCFKNSDPIYSFVSNDADEDDEDRMHVSF